MLKEIRKREKKASKGPWNVEAVSDAVRVIIGQGRSKIILFRGNPKQISEQQTVDNCSFVAHARTDIPKLLELIDRAREIIGYYYAKTESEEAWRFLKDTEE